MNSVREKIDWVGYVDWTVRNFHGYHADKGSTYNAYLIRDKKPVLIDTVKKPFAQSLLSHLSALVDPRSIEYVVCNHAEPDHSGGLPAVIGACSGAALVCNAKCRSALAQHFDTGEWKWKVVSDGDSISIGDRTLTFVDTPMVHWPESMFTYVPEDKLLFSMDAFGQHYASAHRFDDEEPFDVVMGEAKKYYANILMPYGKKVAKTVEKIGGLAIEVIAPSHGVIWRSRLDDILAAYGRWTMCQPTDKVLIVYDTMWESTEMMAKAMLEGAMELGAAAKLFNLRVNNITQLATEMLDAAAAAFGSPTLNTTLMPEMAAALTYLSGLKPAGKAGLAFGSYGWAKGGAQDVEKYLKTMKFEILRGPIMAQYVPTAEKLEECRAAGRMLAERAFAYRTDK